MSDNNKLYEEYVNIATTLLNPIISLIVFLGLLAIFVGVLLS